MCSDMLEKNQVSVTISFERQVLPVICVYMATYIPTDTPKLEDNL